MIREQHLLPERTAYQETIRGLLRLHRLTVDGKEQSDEYHDTCAALETYWHDMSYAERERTGGLSQDLYAVSDSAPERLEPPTSESQALFGNVYEARGREEWDLALTLLRKLDKFVPPPLVAYLRGTIWDGLGERHVAVVFHERAHRLAPENGAFLAAFVSVLKWIDLDGALKLSEPVISASDKYNGNIVVQAVEAFYWDVMRKTEGEAAPTIHRLIEVLKRLLERAGREPPESSGQYLHMTLFLLATFHRTLGLVREAHDYYSQLILLEPRNDALLASRGSLGYESDPSAISDFEQAIKLETQIIWPYYFLALHNLTHGRFIDCWKISAQGLGKMGPRRTHSELLEFIAISMAAIGAHPDQVRQLFEEARRVDPDNERAAENQRRYMAGIAASKAKAVEWELPNSSSVKRWQHERLYTPSPKRAVPYAEN